MAGDSRHEQDCSGRAEGSGQGKQRRERPLPPLRPIEPDRNRGRRREEGEDELEVEPPAPECRRAYEREERPEAPERAQRELGRRKQEVDGDRHECDQRGGPEGDRHVAQARAGNQRHHRPRDRDPQEEEADRRHDREEGEPARSHQLGRRGGFRDGRDHELRRRSRVRSDGEREGAPHRVAVDRDHPPVDEVPAFGEPLHWRDQRVRVRGRAAGRTGGLPVAGGVRHRDDGEPRLDGLAVAQRYLLRRHVDDPARDRRRLQESRVRPRRGRQRQRRRGRGEGNQDGALHARGRLPRDTDAASAAPASRTPTTPTTSATMASVELPPPPRDDFASITGAGVSEDSGPDQSTTEPSEYVCRTLNV